MGRTGKSSAYLAVFTQCQACMISDGWKVADIGLHQHGGACDVAHQFFPFASANHGHAGNRPTIFAQKAQLFPTRFPLNVLQRRKVEQDPYRVFPALGDFHLNLRFDGFDVFWRDLANGLETQARNRPLL